MLSTKLFKQQVIPLFFSSKGRMMCAEKTGGFNLVN